VAFGSASGVVASPDAQPTHALVTAAVIRRQTRRASTSTIGRHGRSGTQGW
jgi:hypothetical protein